MSEDRKRCCCNCGHNKRVPTSRDIECYCDRDGHYIGYLECFEGWCRHWCKEREPEE